MNERVKWWSICGMNSKRPSPFCRWLTTRAPGASWNTQRPARGRADDILARLTPAPDLLVLDDPFEGLDVPTAQGLVRRLVRRLHRRAACVLWTCRRSEVVHPLRPVIRAS